VTGAAEGAEARVDQGVSLSEHERYEEAIRRTGQILEDLDRGARQNLLAFKSVQGRAKTVLHGR
jgi:hypothetical protein